MYHFKAIMIGVSFFIINTSYDKLFAHDLRTLNGSPVTHGHDSDTGWSGHSAEWWTQWADDEWEGLYEERIDRANKAYNCHAYAWGGARQSNSETWSWIGIEGSTHNA